jgi:hypothetical protein
MYEHWNLGLAGTPIPFRGLGPGGIPVALPNGTAAPVTGAVNYTMDIGQFTDHFHPDLPNPTNLKLDTKRWVLEPQHG